MTAKTDEQEFMRLFHGVERSLYRYLLVLVASEADASDILQETAIALWKKFDEYDPQKPFDVWARTFAYMEASKFRLYRQREGKKRSVFVDEVVEQFSHEFEQHEGVLELRLSALEQCVEKLSEEDRELIRTRYSKNKSLRTMADEHGVNEDRLYRRLGKIRATLEACIQRTIAAEGM